MQSTPSPVLEITRFRLAKGVSEADFLTAAEGINAFLREQPGFIRRRMVQDAASFTDIVEWQSKPAAEAAFQAFMTHPLTMPLMGMIDPESLSMEHLPILSAQD